MNVRHSTTVCRARSPLAGAVAAGFIGAALLASLAQGAETSAEARACLETIESICRQPAIVRSDRAGELAAAFAALKRSNPSAETVRQAALLLTYKITHDYWQLRSFCVDLNKQAKHSSLKSILKLSPADVGLLDQKLAKFGQALVMERPLIDNPPERLAPEEAWEVIDTHLPFMAPDGDASLARLWSAFERLLAPAMAGSESKYQAALAKVRAAWRARPQDLNALPEDEARFVKVLGRTRMYYRRFAGLTPP